MYADERVSMWIYKIFMIYNHYIFAMRSKNFIGDIQKSLTLQLKWFLFVSCADQFWNVVYMYISVCVYVFVEVDDEVET